MTAPAAPATLDHPITHAYRDVPVVLLSGMGRSGTNVVRRVLGLHPDLDSTERENNIISDLVRVAHRNETEPSRVYAMRVSRDRHRALFRGLILDLLWPQPRPEPPAALLAYSNLDAERARYLLDLVPGCRIVYLLRHGVEVVSSRLLYPTFRDRPFREHCVNWDTAARTGAWGAARGDFHLLRHERLLDPRDAAIALEEVWDFVGLPPAPEAAAALEQWQPADVTRHPGESAEAAVDPAARVERWRFRTDEQKRMFEDICGAGMRRLGYDIPW